MLLHILGLSHSFVSDVTFFSPKGALNCTEPGAAGPPRSLSPLHRTVGHRQLHFQLVALGRTFFADLAAAILPERFVYPCLQRPSKALTWPWVRRHASTG